MVVAALTLEVGDSSSSALLPGKQYERGKAVHSSRNNSIHEWETLLSGDLVGLVSRASLSKKAASVASSRRDSIASRQRSRLSDIEKEDEAADIILDDKQQQPIRTITRQALYNQLQRML